MNETPARTVSIMTTASEGATEKYARQTRNAVVFIAVIVGLAFALTVVGTIVELVELHSLENAISNFIGQLGSSGTGF